MKILPNTITEIEKYFGESLCDIDGWKSNPFTILGFAYGRDFWNVGEMQNECDKYGYNAELVLYDFFKDDGQYYAFYADLCNQIPAYNRRIVEILSRLNG